MPIIELTGTATERFNEISDRWVVLSPVATDKFLNYGIYTTPLGQTFAAEVRVQSGSVPFSGSTVFVNKDVHVFESELEADRFINEMGEESISSVSERFRVQEDLTIRKITEVQLVNLSEIAIEFELLNSRLQRGYKVEVFSSGSTGLYEIQKDPEYNARDEIVSDTFLKYFEIEEK